MNESNNKGSKVVIAIIALIAAIFGVRALTSTPVPEAPVVNVGAVSGPDIFSPYLAVNGLTAFHNRIAMAPATTTVCAIKAPAATSTLLRATFQITTGTTTAATIDLGTSTNAFSTTTNLIAAKSIASGAQGYATWYPTGASLDDNKIAPNEFVVVKTAGAGLGGYTYGGTCTAIFQVL